jgi:hypothetical protein
MIGPTTSATQPSDPAEPELFSRCACDLTPNSELILLDSGHFLPISEPVAVAEALVLFGTGERAWLPPVVAAAGHGIALPRRPKG